MRTWAFVAVWPYSRYRYVEVVLDQSVPTFLSCVQNAVIAAGAVPERISVDNLAAAVLREHFHERAYQREFALFCAHYSTMPNAVRPRTPTDKGSVENGVGAVKKGLRGRDFQSFDELQGAVGAWMHAMNARPNAATAKRPDDLIADERGGLLPEPYPIAAWSEHRVRTDCHVQVRSNFYSVPHEHVGKRVVVRVDANTVTVYVDFEAVARHERQIGRADEHRATPRAGQRRDDPDERMPWARGLRPPRNAVEFRQRRVALGHHDDVLQDDAQGRERIADERTAAERRGRLRPAQPASSATGEQDADRLRGGGHR